MAHTRKRTTRGRSPGARAASVKGRSKSPVKRTAAARTPKRPPEDACVPPIAVGEDDIVADAAIPIPSRRQLSPIWAMGVGAVLLIVVLLVGATKGRHRVTAAVASPPPSAPMSQAPTAELQSFAPPSSEYERERALGHVVFAEGRRLAALRYYDRALRIDRAAIDRQMIDNLIACYGARREQPEAATLIVRYQLGATKAALEALEHTGRTHGIRAGAHYTLEKLGPSSRDYVTRANVRSAG